MVLSSEYGYIALLFALFVIPRALQRFRVPAAFASLALGAVAGLVLGWFQHDSTLQLLSTFGIVSLFLFAGLEADLREMRLNAMVLAQHLVVRASLLALVAIAIVHVLQLEVREAALLSLALLTPSTGFILNSIDAMSLTPAERGWVKSKAIASEVLALVVMFGVLQSTTVERMAISIAVLAGMVALLPLIFRTFAALVVPFAPRSEFAFLLMIAVSCAFVTRQLGVYYLVGAFVVGMAAQRFRERLPSLASEELVHAVEMFASFFVPFYFFHAGLELRREDLDLRSVAYGAAFLVLIVPLRIGTVMLHRRVALGEPGRESARVAIALLPTLVFGLVIAGILRDRFNASPPLFGGVILYTLATTLIPAFVFKREIPEYAAPRAPQLPAAQGMPRGAD